MFKDPVMVSNKKTGKLFVTTTIALVFLAVASATDLQNIEIIEPVDSRQINVTGNLSMEGNILEGVADPDNGNDVMDRDYADSRYLNRAGDYMTGNLDLNGYNITNFFNSTCNSDQLVNQVYENGSYNCVDPSTISTTENLAQTLTEGNYGGGTAIYMNQSGIFEIGESINLTASGNIEVSGTTDGINLDNPGNAISLSSNQYLIDSNAIGNDEIRFDAVNNSQLAQGTCSNDQVLKWNGSEWECVNTDGFGTDNQSLTGYNNTDGVNDTIYIENGNNITIRDDVADADADPTNELQNLSEVLVQGNTANQSIDMDGNNVSGIDRLNPEGETVNLGSNATMADGTSLADVNRITDLPLKWVIDDFEDDDFSEYSETKDGSDSGDIKYGAYSGDNPVGQSGLEINVSDATAGQTYGAALLLESSSGLETYPEAGDTFEYYLYDEATAEFSYLFGSNGTHSYQVRKYKGDIFITKSKIETFPSSNIDMKSSKVVDSYPDNEWLRVKVEWEKDGKITATLFDDGVKQGSGSIQDTEFKSGETGINYEASGYSVGEAKLDGVKIIEDGIEMDTDLDLQNHSVDSVEKVNSGGQTVSTGGSVEVGDGNVGAPGTTRMCIGDRCT